MIIENGAVRKPLPRACPHCGGQLDDRKRTPWHAEAVKMRAEGWSYTAISKRYGVSPRRGRRRGRRC
jgi:hypothetical protein